MPVSLVVPRFDSRSGSLKKVIEIIIDFVFWGCVFYGKTPGGTAPHRSPNSGCTKTQISEQIKWTIKTSENKFQIKHGNDSLILRLNNRRGSLQYIDGDYGCDVDHGLRIDVQNDANQPTCATIIFWGMCSNGEFAQGKLIWHPNSCAESVWSASGFQVSSHCSSRTPTQEWGATVDESVSAYKDLQSLIVCMHKSCLIVAMRVLVGCAHTYCSFFVCVHASPNIDWNQFMGAQGDICFLLTAVLLCCIGVVWNRAS